MGSEHAWKFLPLSFCAVGRIALQTLAQHTECFHSQHPTSSPNLIEKKKMSFQDVGKRNSNRNAATAGFSGANVRSNNTSSQQGSMFGGMSNTFGGSGSVSQISESLTQYQRNVGILEKIAQQLLATGSGRVNNRTELEQQ